MSNRFEELIERVQAWPDEEKDRLAEIILDLEAERNGVDHGSNDA